MSAETCPNDAMPACRDPVIVPRARIEQAKVDGKAGRFATVPGDDQAFIPLP
jgi:hypothetical protein